MPTLGRWPSIAVTVVVGLIVRLGYPLAIAAALVGASFTVANLSFVAPPRLRAPFELALCVGLGLSAAELAARRAPAMDSADA